MQSTESRPGGVEWRTIALAAVIYGAWLGLVLSADQLWWWLTAPLLAVTLAWHGSLQHELLHGHPFASQTANNVLASVPLALRLPFPVYRLYHLEHHRAVQLTCPVNDPESYYRTPSAWNRTARPAKWVANAHQTLLGRMVLGPALDMAGVWSSQARKIAGGDRSLARTWAQHAVFVALFSYALFGVLNMAVGTYLLAAYLGHGLSLVRSFCEHRWVPDGASRSAVVRAGPFFSLLFLNNNLHHTHHARPGAAWYRLPALAQELGSDRAAQAGAGLYAGYSDVARRYGLHPVNPIVHPSTQP